MWPVAVNMNEDVISGNVTCTSGAGGALTTKRVSRYSRHSAPTTLSATTAARALAALTEVSSMTAFSLRCTIDI